MSRRRGWGYVLLAPARWIAEAFRLLVMVPYYETVRMLDQFGRWVVGGTGSKSFIGVVGYYVLWLPLTLWHITVAIGRAIAAAAGSWPQQMRLQDLATGIPALVIAVPVIVALSALNMDRNELTGMYQKGMNESVNAAMKTKDQKEQTAEMRNALFYARSLVRIDPEEQMFRFNLAQLYISSGDNARGMTMMNELAPRYGQGFGPAHFKMAKMYLSPPFKAENYVAAKSHLDRAISGTGKDAVDQDEVHRMLGTIYLNNASGMRKYGENPLNISPESSIAQAKDHFGKYKGSDPEVAFRLAGILVSEGFVDVAKGKLQKVLDDLDQKLKFNGDDVVTRIDLARAYTTLGNFAEAATILQEGRNRTPDPRLDQALSQVYFTLSERARVTSRAAPELAFNTLEKAYAIDPENIAVVARFAQALFDEEAERARAVKSLEAMPPQVRNRGVTKLLLAVDAERRKLPQRAEELTNEASADKSGSAPAMIGEVAQGAFEKRFPGLTPDQASLLLSKAMRLWPTHPDLLFARATRYAQADQFTTAASLLKKAVDEREKNVTLKLRVAYDARLYGHLAAYYLRAGQREQAGVYQLKAESATAKRDVLK